MKLVDWLIILIPIAAVMLIGFHTRRYIRGVADFLVAGRLCGRYVISVGDVATALSIIGLVAYVECQYKTGFALSFWNGFILPLTLLISLTGYCTYRFRETKAMSLGQFLEIRYSRSLRIFAATLRSISEMLANMIMPAVAARFFLYFFGFPETVHCFGLAIPSFTLIVVAVLVMAISLICMGGTLALVITDAIQGMLCYPLLVALILFVLSHFSWDQEIVPVMMDRVAGESFLNPFDVENLRDFNLFMLVIGFLTMIVHRASWIGAGITSAAKSPHEQKMAGLLGTWRNTLGVVFYLLIAIAVITVMNHRNFAPQSKEIRTQLIHRISDDIIVEPGVREEIRRSAELVAPPQHQPDAPAQNQLSERDNPDTPYLDAVYQTLSDTPGGNAKFQEFRTLYYQLMTAVSMRHLLPPVMLGCFGLLMILAMLSTDDSRIFSAALTITQDVILPLRRKPFTPKQQINVIRLVSVGVGIFFFCGSFFMAQLDYITLFVTIMTMMWLGGCGPVMIFGLYSRFGTTAGAFTSLIAGMILSVGGILLQRNWAGGIYPLLERYELVEATGTLLTRVSSPFNPYIVWEMNPVKCPINSYEFYFMTMVITFALYCIVSHLTCRKPFNLERMLHRGKYAIDGERKIKLSWTPRRILANLIGITPEYTRGDKTIAWGFFLYSFLYSFVLIFIGVLVWNWLSPWPLEWWGHYFWWVNLLIPIVVAFGSTVWFGIGGALDLFRLFRDLKARSVVNELDNGMVEGHVSLADQVPLQKIRPEKGSDHE